MLLAAGFDHSVMGGILCSYYLPCCLQRGRDNSCFEIWCWRWYLSFRKASTNDPTWSCWRRTYRSSSIYSWVRSRHCLVENRYDLAVLHLAILFTSHLPTHFQATFFGSNPAYSIESCQKLSRVHSGRTTRTMLILCDVYIDNSSSIAVYPSTVFGATAA